MKRIHAGTSLDSGSHKIIKINYSTIVGSSLSSPVLMKNNEQWAHTQSTLYNIKFKWIIDNFSFRQEKFGERLVSPEFYSDANENIKWCLVLFPNGNNEEQKDFLSFFVRLVPDDSFNRPRITAKFKFSILNSEPHKTYHSYFSESTNFESDRIVGFQRFFKRSLLLNAIYGFLPDDKLTLLCEVAFVSDSISISSQESIGQFKVPECKVTDDLANLLHGQEFSDVILVVGEYELPAHKAILAARSDVFAAMFKHEMEECRSGRITITDLNHEVLQEMLHYIYTGEVPKLKEMANNLLAAADKYGLRKLKVLAEEMLFAEMSIESAADILVLADRHSADQLKEHAKRFIKNNANDIILTKGWQNMINANAYTSLIAETLEALITQPQLHPRIP